MAIAGYSLQCYAPSAYDVGGGWYNYSFWCKASASATSYTSYRNYALIAYWNGTGWVADAIVSLSLEGMAYNGYGQVWGYSQGQTVHMAAWFYNNYPSTSIGSYVSYQDDWFADAWITLPTVTVNYTVTYNGNGATSGSPNPTSQTVSSGASTVLGTVGTAEKPGYHADGWAESASGAKTKDFEATYTVTGNKTFYLHWLANTYTVVYNGNGNTGGSTASSSHTYDTAKALTANGFTKTNYTFIGWATSPGGSAVYSNQQSVLNLTTENEGTVNLYAVWEDTTEKASYIQEHITNKAYLLKDPNAVHGTTSYTGRNVKWATTGSKDIDQSWLLSSGAPPSTVSNGAKYVVNNQPSSYPNYTSWQAGNTVNISPELAYAAIKVIFVSETPTTYTVELHTSAYGGGYTGGFNDGNYDWSIKISTNGGSSFTQIAGATNTWCHFGGSGGWLRSDSPGIYDNTAYVINKTNSAQSVVFRVSNYFHGYGTSTKDISFTVPAQGQGPAVGYSSAWKHSVVWVKHSGTWKQAQMWMKVNGTWTKAWY